jgi:hypothetical protein
MSEIIQINNKTYFDAELDVEDRDVYDFLSDIDEINISTAFKNSKYWFGDQFPLDIIDEYYGKIIKINSKEFKPYIRIKIHTIDDKLPDFINDKDFKIGNLISPIIECDGLIFSKQRFSCEWSLQNYEIQNNYEFNIKEEVKFKEDEDIIIYDDEKKEDDIKKIVIKEVKKDESKIKKDESKTKKEELKIKKEESNIKKEELKIKEELTVKKEESNIKEEPKIKEEEKKIKDMDEEKKRKKKIIYANRNRVWQ